MNKKLYLLSLAAGIFILLSGIFFKLNNHFASGLLFRKDGTVTSGTIDGNGALVLGIMILSFSVWMYKEYKTKKREREKILKQEEMKFWQGKKIQNKNDEKNG